MNRLERAGVIYDTFCSVCARDSTTLNSITERRAPRSAARGSFLWGGFGVPDGHCVRRPLIANAVVVKDTLRGREHFCPGKYQRLAITVVKGNRNKLALGIPQNLHQMFEIPDVNAIDRFDHLAKRR